MKSIVIQIFIEDISISLFYVYNFVFLVFLYNFAKKMTVVEQHILIEEFGYLILCSVTFFFLWLYLQRIKSKRTIPVNQNSGEKILNDLNIWKLEIQAVNNHISEETNGLTFKEKEEFIKENYRKSFCLDDEKEFLFLIDKKVPGFTKKIKDIHPNLSTNDIKLLVFILLEIPTNDILNILSYSPNSLPTTKQRLCKKLGISSVTQICDHIYSLF